MGWRIRLKPRDLRPSILYAILGVPLRGANLRACVCYRPSLDDNYPG